MNTQPDQPDDRDLEFPVLLDPAFEPSAEQPDPPPEQIIGGWEVDPAGGTGRFRPNPHHVPSSPEVPSDPVDGMLRLLARGEADGEDVLAALGEIDLVVALDAAGVALVGAAPDGVRCVLAATAPRHRAPVVAAAAPPVAGWREVTVTELAAALPDDGVDVLLNPHGPAPFRIAAAAVRDVAAGRAPLLRA